MDTPSPPSHRLDPRLFQIAALGSLALYGLFALDLEIRPVVALVLLPGVLVTQWVFTRLYHLPSFDPKSALISGLSLCLLLRTDSLALAAVAALVTIASKFLLRVRGKHVFNPTNFGLAVMMLATDRVWVSPGQWGSAAFFGFFLACAGFVVVTRARRADVTWAFLASYALVLFGRAAWLGDPWVIPLHQLQNGALLIFAFFMISDPKTTPDTRAGRIFFAFLVALGAGYVQFRLFRTNGLIWSLFFCSFLVPLIDRFSTGERYRWPEPPPFQLSRRFAMRRSTILALAVLALTAAPPARAFCGFYVAKADTKLFNRSSKVVLVRDADRTVLTMASDYQGDPKEFALVVPVPTFLEREQIHVGERAVIEHLDAYSAPRLVEYFDPDPCQPSPDAVFRNQAAPSAAAKEARADAEARSLGVTIEARYTVGEYDILILSAKESDGLETWLRQNGYRLPPGASNVLGSYIRQKMRFFVARVNLEEQSRLGYTYLRPLQVAYESPKFMLPIRLGTVNADGPQDLFIFALTRTGRIETTNYRTVRLPSDVELPPYVREEFAELYRAMFTRQVEKERMHAVFLEYAWDMGWCDPCAADPLSPQELRELGVFWVGASGESFAPPNRRPFPQPQPADVFITRLHLRYTAETFPEDLVFQETGDRSNFQARYVLRHPWKGPARCAGASSYFSQLRERQEREAQNLASLTGWGLEKIRGRIDFPTSAAPAGEEEPWWKKLWGKDGR